MATTNLLQVNILYAVATDTLQKIMYRQNGNGISQHDVIFCTAMTRDGSHDITCTMVTKTQCYL